MTMSGVAYLYIHKLRVTYAAIAMKIDELIEHLNTIEASEHDDVRALAVRIGIFLDRLNYSIMHEMKEGKSMNHALFEFKDTFLAELADIRKLKEAIIIAPDHPNAEVIRRIHTLSAELTDELKKQEHAARRVG